MLDRALEYYNKAIDINPRYVRAYVNRGDVYDKKGDKDRAISSYRRALDFDPVHKGALEALAKLGVTP
jgi:tetratricopeptide (TPR) repeat protein